MSLNKIMANHLESKKYLAWVRTQACLHCGNTETAPHHVIGIKDGKMGGKAADIHAVPLCVRCHNEFHGDPIGWPQLLWICKTQEQAIRDGVLVVK